MVIMRFDFKSLNDKIVNSASSLSLSQPKKRGSHFLGCSSFGFESFLEKERVILSRISEDPTVGGLRGEKEKGSTRGKLRVDSGIESFFKLLEV